MVLALADRVQETTTTTGTGTITLGGAVAQCQSFASGVGSGNTTYYTLLSGDGTSWEVGLGTIGGTGPYTLARTTVLDGSSGTSPISLSGTSIVFCDLPASTVIRPTPPGEATWNYPTLAGIGAGTWYNQSPNGATIADIPGGGIVFAATAVAPSDQNSGYGLTVPSGSSWACTARFVPSMGIYTKSGLFMLETSSGKLTTFMQQPVNSGANYIYTQVYSSSGGSYVGNINVQNFSDTRQMNWMRIRFASSTYYMDFGPDGMNWINHSSFAETAYFNTAANVIGFGVERNGGTADALEGVNCWSFSLG